MTPEGKIKREINKVLVSYGEELWDYMPVPTGYGRATLDYILCFRGRFVAIEAKAPGKKPTPRQHLTIRELERAGAQVFVIDSVEKTQELKKYLDWIANATSAYQQQT